MGESKIEASNNISMGESRSNTLTNQNVIIMRHGHRMDNFDDDWAPKAARKWDPPLYKTGTERAFKEGRNMRLNIGFPIHRVIVSPFLRCLETANEVVHALCAIVNGDDELLDMSTSTIPKVVEIDSSKIKVSIEYGLCEMLNSIAIRPEMAPEDGKFDFDISDCESELPPGTIDRDAKPVYNELPKWGETVEDARSRYVKVVKALADKYPIENLLLVTHGEGLGANFSALKGVNPYAVEYCSYLHSRRSISWENQSFTGSELEYVEQSGISF